MEIFKTDILKKESEKFQKKDLIEIFECGYCQKKVCESFHKNFFQLAVNFVGKNFGKVVNISISQKKIFIIY